MYQKFTHIKTVFLLSQHCLEEDDQDEIPTRDVSYSLTPVSKRMIDQFFTEDEGPDRDWQQ